MRLCSRPEAAGRHHSALSCGDNDIDGVGEGWSGWGEEGSGEEKY